MNPTVAIAASNIVLIYSNLGVLNKNIYTYGTTTWASTLTLVPGAHPGLTNRSNILWLVWEDNSTIYYALSADNGENFNVGSPTALPLAGGVKVPAITVLPNSYVGIVYSTTLAGYSSSCSSSLSSNSFSSSSSSSS